MKLVLSRRGAIAGGAAVAALPLLAGFAAVGAHPFLYDARLDRDGRLLADARRLGLRPSPIADLGGITHDLEQGRHGELAGIAGVTTPAAFFVVEQIAARRGLRLRDRRGSWWAFGAIGSGSGGMWA